MAAEGMAFLRKGFDNTQSREDQLGGLTVKAGPLLPPKMFTVGRSETGKGYVGTTQAG